jgi:hypothetical protein
VELEKRRSLGRLFVSWLSERETPTASRCVVTVLARSNALYMIEKRREIPHWILTSSSAIAAEVLVNNAG